LISEIELAFLAHLGDEEALPASFRNREAIMHSAAAIQTGALVVDPVTRVVSLNDRPLRLTPKEYAIMELLSLRKGAVLTKEMMLNHLYGGLDEPEHKIIDVFVCKLRKKLALATGGCHFIETVWGRGYVMRDPVSDASRYDAPGTAQYQALSAVA
jgi:two-component system, cell cycle response regulator CtrA